MQIYSYSPKRTNQKALILSIALVGIPLIGLVVGGILSIPYYSVLQTVAAVCLAAAVLIAGRFCLRDYQYDIMDSDQGERLIRVVEIQGKRKAIVCMMDLSNLETCKRVDKTNLREVTDYENNQEVKGKRYNYCVDISPKESFRLYFRDGTILQIMPDETMRQLIEKEMQNPLLGQE